MNKTLLSALSVCALLLVGSFLIVSSFKSPKLESLSPTEVLVHAENTQTSFLDRLKSVLGVQKKKTVKVSFEKYFLEAATDLDHDLEKGRAKPSAILSRGQSYLKKQLPNTLSQVDYDSTYKLGRALYSVRWALLEDPSLASSLDKKTILQLTRHKVQSLGYDAVNILMDLDNGQFISENFSQLGEKAYAADLLMKANPKSHKALVSSYVQESLQGSSADAQAALPLAIKYGLTKKLSSLCHLKKENALSFYAMKEQLLARGSQLQCP